MSASLGRSNLNKYVLPALSFLLTGCVALFGLFVCWTEFSQGPPDVTACLLLSEWSLSL